MTDARGIVAEELGRLYEVAFNVGSLTAIRDSGVGDEVVELYREDMRRWKLGAAMDGMVRKAGIHDPAFEKIVRHASEYLFTKGYISGLLFMEEYLRRVKPRKHSAAKLLYFGCDFDGDNAFGQWMKPGSRSAREKSLEALLGKPLEEWEVAKWKGAGRKGEFLHADLLALFEVGRRNPHYRVLSVDFSAFSGGGLLRSDIAEPDSQRAMLARELYAMRAKSVFSGLYVDTGSPASPESLYSAARIPEGLRDYLGAFKYRDKEVVKVVQAGAYAHSFYEAMLEERRLSGSEDVRFTCIGHTDRDSVSISVGAGERAMLRTCHDIYKNHKANRGIPRDRKRVTSLIAKNAAEAFEGGEGFVESILELPESTASGMARIVHEERLEDFARPQETLPEEMLARLGLAGGLSLREAHRRLIRGSLGAESKDLYVFLTGSPGIGKTTSIVSFLEDHADEGFLFFYVSPRKQVNRDVTAKFTEEEPDYGLLCINSNREILDEAGSRPAVEFRAYGELRKEILEKGEVSGVRFFDEGRPGAPSSGGRTNRATTRDTRTITGKEGGGVGVLYSVFRGAHAAMEGGLSRNIVATVAVQALKKTRSGNTLKHLPEMFRGVLKDGREPIPEKMRELSGRVRHVFFMVDEITGDPAGAEFLSRLGSELGELGLTDERHGFNTKVIVADASIVDKGVIEQHLAESDSEPDKIFFRSATRSNDPLTLERFSYKDKFPAVVINADCYPAKALDVRYEILCEASPFDAARNPSNGRDLSKAALDNIAEDVVELVRGGAEKNGQILVYIQDKARISALIEDVKARLAADGGKFEKPGDFIEIHANLPAREEKAVEANKDGAKVVFMTSSASRGLSFGRARSILVEVPRFSLEQNLMELIQVIYRGRGCDVEDVKEKSLRFYISESIFHDANEKERTDAIREGAMNLLTFLLILKASVMTRVRGAGRIGGSDFLMVPVGGKNVSFAGESHSDGIVAFLKALASEIRRDPRRGHSLQKEVYEPISDLFDSGSYAVRNSPWARAAKGFRPKFLDRAGRSLEVLLEEPPLDGGGDPGASAVGGLLVAAYGGEEGLEEAYSLRAARVMGHETLDKIRRRLWAIQKGEGYPDDLRHKCFAPLDIIEEILGEDGGRSRTFEQTTRRPDRYFALPLSLFVFGERMEEWMKIANSTESRSPSERDRGGLSFRLLLENTLKARFPVEGALPVGYEYERFPFLVFNSYNLPELRGKLFAEKQILASNELNVLMLILARG